MTQYAVEIHAMPHCAVGACWHALQAYTVLCLYSADLVTGMLCLTVWSARRAMSHRAAEACCHASVCC